MGNEPKFTWDELRIAAATGNAPEKMKKHPFDKLRAGEELTPAEAEFLKAFFKDKNRAA